MRGRRCVALGCCANPQAGRPLLFVDIFKEPGRRLAQSDHVGQRFFVASMGWVSAGPPPQGEGDHPQGSGGVRARIGRVRPMVPLHHLRWCPSPFRGGAQRSDSDFASCDPPCRAAMGRWQREALTEGLWRDVGAPPPPLRGGPAGAARRLRLPHGFATGRIYDRNPSQPDIPPNSAAPPTPLFHSRPPCPRLLPTP